MDFQYWMREFVEKDGRFVNNMELTKNIKIINHANVIENMESTKHVNEINHVQ